MDVGRVASLFIAGPESFLQANDMVLTLDMMHPVELDRLIASYESLVRAHDVLRVEWVAVGDRFAWRPLGDDALARMLERERAVLRAPPGESEFAPTGSRLPLRIARLSESRVAFVVNHAWSNGHGALHWLEHWLALYRAEPTSVVVAAPAEPPTLVARVARAVRGVFWALVYLVSFVARAGRNAGEATVDLSRGKTPAPHRQGYTVRPRQLSEEATAQLVRRARETGQSVSELICAALARAFLAAQPAKTRVCISMPVDVGAQTPGWTRREPGNYTASVIAQVDGRRAIEPQVRAAFRAFARGVPYWIARVVGATAKSERALRDHFAKQAATSIPARAPFENFTFALTSLGVLRGRQLDAQVEALIPSTCTQTVLVAAFTHRSRLSLVSTSANDLFDPAEVASVIDGAIGLLDSESARDDALASAIG